MASPKARQAGFDVRLAIAKSQDVCTAHDSEVIQKAARYRINEGGKPRPHGTRRHRRKLPIRADIDPRVRMGRRTSRHKQPRRNRLFNGRKMVGCDGATFLSRQWRMIECAGSPTRTCPCAEIALDLSGLALRETEVLHRKCDAGGANDVDELRNTCLRLEASALGTIERAPKLNKIQKEYDQAPSRSPNVARMAINFRAIKS